MAVVLALLEQAALAHPVEDRALRLLLRPPGQLGDEVAHAAVVGDQRGGMCRAHASTLRAGNSTSAQVPCGATGVSTHASSGASGATSTPGTPALTGSRFTRSNQQQGTENDSERRDTHSPLRYSASKLGAYKLDISRKLRNGIVIGLLHGCLLKE